MKKLIQGDVILMRVDKLPTNATKQTIEQRFGRLVLQESEITGHHHHFMPDAEVDLYELDALADDISRKTITPMFKERYIIVKAKTTGLFHGKGFNPDPAKDGVGDHKVLPIEPGIYKVKIVQEYDYLKNEAVQVRD